MVILNKLALKMMDGRSVLYNDDHELQNNEMTRTTTRRRLWERPNSVTSEV